MLKKIILITAIVTSTLFASTLQATENDVAAANDPALSLEVAKITPADPEWTKNLPLDPIAATEAYMQRISPAAKQRADSYFEGGYYITVANFLWSLGIALLLLISGLSARARDLAERKFKNKNLQVFGYGLAYTFATQILSFPLAVYEGFFREHTYGLSNQTFLEWLREQFITFSLALVFGGLVLVILYLFIRRFEKSWAYYGTAIMIALLSFMMLIGPTYIDPLFNTYKPLEQSSLKDQLLLMAEANGIPAHDVLQFDASKQSDRISANVSGIFGSAAIRLNDNLIRRTTPAEVRSVMGHEMGHYALNHVYKGIAFFIIIIFIGFLFVDRSFAFYKNKFSGRMKIKSISDVAGLPLLAALFSVYMFILTPITNTIIRTQEAEADLFALNTAAEPDAEAEVDLKLTEYRKPDPGPIEEFIFFDHPSTRNRVLMAMRWKAAKLKAKDIKAD